ncbi:hypothetical protein SAMN05216184_108133 [Georgenia satyanarayanai]|uniref:Uncharacterized protein n=1 Tax=Georgenia satyanarayanai TaxID=860221 RepID=A0A2Y9ALV2_9MICO|nr:hypothetical protein A8987_108133 [Georgenia satyanarayanai]SSA43369.1 hypothetical protein SAMN05216184_108133 [Georgenia satyanarayanai]
MSATQERESRPAGNGTASQKLAGQAPTAYRDRAPNGTSATLSGYAVVVTIPADSEPRTRRRLFLSLHSATRAVTKAEARGFDAQVTLVRLVPEGVGSW